MELKTMRMALKNKNILRAVFSELQENTNKESIQRKKAQSCGLCLENLQLEGKNLNEEGELQLLFSVLPCHVMLSLCEWQSEYSFAANSNVKITF